MRSLPIPAAPKRRLRLLLVSAAALAAAPLQALPAGAAPPSAPSPPIAAAPAPSPPVTLAEVTTQVNPAATHLPNATDLLRLSADAELRAIDWTKEGLRRRYLLSATLVRLESVPADGVLRASCAVSAAVRDERGTLVAIIEGRARADASPEAAATAERGALEGAVQGAIRRVPEAIRKAQ
jgi:hypothetical protein